MITLTRRRGLALAVLVLLLVCLLGWKLWADQRLNEARRLQNELFGPQARHLTAEQRRERWETFRAAQAQLSPAQRRTLSNEARRRRQAEIARYFTLSAQEKTRYLDDLIRRERSRSANQGRRARGAAGTPTGLGASPGPGSSSPRTTQQRDRARQRFLDSSSPAERAQMARFQRDLNARRAQLGLPPRGSR